MRLARVNAPDFSGKWSLVSSTFTGRGRGESGGSDSTINHPKGSHYVVHAKWEGDELVVTYQAPWNFTVTQVLSIDDGKLTVVTHFNVGDGPSTLTYVKG